MFKKLIPLLSLALFLAVAPTASLAGNYDARRNESLSVLESLRLEPRWNDSLKAKLITYYDLRERVLTDALPIVQDSSTSNREQAAKWRDHFSKQGPEAVKTLRSAFQDAMPAAALNFLTAQVAMESDFYVKLGNMPIAFLRDRISLYRETFDRASRSLADKWRELDSTDQSIDSRARSAQAEFRDLYRSAADSIATTSISAEKWVIWVVEMASNIPGTPEFAGPVIDMLKLLENLETRTVNYAERLRELYSTEERVIILFNNTRKDVADFLKTMNFTLLTNEMNELLIATQQAGRTLATRGQQDDAERFASLLGIIIKGHYEDFEDKFEYFTKEFDHIFFNALGDKTIDTLIETYSWRDWSDGMRGVALEQSLRRLHEQASRNFGVDITRVQDPAQREVVRKWVEKNMEALKERVGKVEGTSVSDRVRLVVYSALPSSLREKLLNRLTSGN